jgi:Putative mono-oxygenase ydhR
MFVSQVLFDLSDSAVDREQLLDYVRAESVDMFAAMPGLRLKLWIADDASQTWGAIYLWESREACLAAGPMPGRAAELIGHGPAKVLDFDVEASVEGIFTSAQLSRAGRAFTG